MLKQREQKLVVCLNCAHVYENIEGQLLCPSCKYVADRDTYDKLINYATEAVYFGYMYREEYEAQLEKEKSIKVKHLLAEPSVVLSFVGLAAVSGVIGGIAYDLVKKIIKMIIADYKKATRSEPELHDVVIDQESIDRIIKYIYDYCNGLKNVEPRLRDVILEERIVDESTKITFGGEPEYLVFNDEEKMTEHLEEMFGEENLKKMIATMALAAQKVKEDADRPKPKEFQNMWKDFLK